MQRSPLVPRLLDQRRRLARWHARCVITVKFACLGWRLGGLREQVEDRRARVARALGR